MADLIERYKITANLPSVLMNYCNRFNSKQLESITEMIYELENSIESADVQTVKHGQWITKAEDYYKKWQNSGRSWDDMPYFVTGEHIACSECFTEYDVCTEGIEHWIGCPCCLARMDGDTQ